MRQGTLLLAIGLVVAASPVQAGMTVYDLNDVARLRLEEISFFAVLLLICALGIRVLWNMVAKDMPRWPRLTYAKALCLTGLLGLMTLLVLSMISGARELLTPGAWRKQGAAYRLNDPASEPLRRQSLESLRTALWHYAQHHEGKFPAHDFIPDLAEKIWQSPDAHGTRYLYIGGQTTAAQTNVLACEPPTFGRDRLVLFSSGDIKLLPTAEILQRVGSMGTAW